MFQILPDLPAHVVGFVIDGTVTRPDVDALYRELGRALDAGPTHLYAEVDGLGGLTVEALFANVTRKLGLLSRLGRLRRYAVVTDAGWIGTLSQLPVPGGPEVRVWPAADRAEALAWASEPVAR